MNTLYKKTVLITGVNTGLGFYTSRFFILKGFAVFGIGRKTNYLLDNVKGFNFVFFNFTVGNANKLKNLILSLKTSVCVNNAGFSNLSHFYKNTLGGLKDHLNVMLTPAFTTSVLNYKRVNNDCSLVYMNSLSSLYPMPFMSIYNVCKSSLTGLFRSLDFENGKVNTRYFNFLLGDVKTGFNTKLEGTFKTTSSLIKTHLRVWGTINSNILKAPHPYSIVLSIGRFLRAQVGGEFVVSSFGQKALTFLGALANWRLVRVFLRFYYSL